MEPVLGGSGPRTHKWLRTMVGKSSKDRVVGPLPNGRTVWLINVGDPFTTYWPSWDDPPSVHTDILIVQPVLAFKLSFGVVLSASFEKAFARCNLVVARCTI